MGIILPLSSMKYDFLFSVHIIGVSAHANVVPEMFAVA